MTTMRTILNSVFHKTHAEVDSQADEGLLNEMNVLRAKLHRFELGWPPGHFYSPIPDLDKIRSREEMIWREPSRTLPGINLREEQQLELYEKLARHCRFQPWSDDKKKGIRYYFNNDNYSYGEALIHLGMMMEFRPRQIIEIGSGFSSCVSMDVNDLLLDGRAKLTCIEPYPNLLYSLMNDDDRGLASIHSCDLQDVDHSIFEQLEENDILFIDSTHVSKVNSDVNHILFDILPHLKKGVIIHFHDICYPFEYPKAWIYQGRAWNEAYMLKAFLQYNESFQIMMFNSFIGIFHYNLLSEKTPLIARNPGSSIWLKKV